ncbi:hypothetical protein [Alcanivorax sp. 1008]|uniref:hypothetical protein n=1 Tax=Alcanivorax sp. 1008 TaxID=2816853 RepID=UPI001D624CB2|nr:hypothetical protein [Alcanivorax sp. 1008]MCC1497813.1 hypothetical protein [Alcanivorax sp. 1008]
MRRYLASLLLVLPLTLQAACPPLDDTPPVRLPGKQTVDRYQQLCDDDGLPAAPLFQDQPLQAVPDRWRIVDSLPGYSHSLWNPYQRNVLKGDKPVWGEWFFALAAVSDTVIELRELPTPVGNQTTANAGDIDVFGSGEQSTFNQNLLIELVWLRGDTVFRPPDWEFRFIPVFNFNRSEVEEARALYIDPREGTTRNDDHIGIQGAFMDYHIRNVSDRYDFDSIRVGIQPFNADFRGFLFQDSPFGIRLFGTRDNNIFQYNLAWFRRLEKDTNSGLNDIGAQLRNDDIFVANLYWQDFLKKGFISQLTLLHNRNREDDFFYDNNGFIARPASLGREVPRSYDVTYLGYNGDGHLGRLNLTASLYAAAGTNEPGVMNDERTEVRATFAAFEAGLDINWIRLRATAVHASGDRNPFDDLETGFDAVFENPIIAGADTSFWIRQGVPFIAGGGVTLSTRNGLLPNLRSSKEHGQSNFTNPGLRLLGVGADLDLTPTTRLSFNANHLSFDRTEVIEVLRQQENIDREIGWDLSAALIWRPMAIQNIVARLSVATLMPGNGFDELFKTESNYSVLGNLILTY